MEERMDTFVEYVTNLTAPFVLEQLWIKLEIWLVQYVLVWRNAGQIAIVAAAFVAARLLAPRVRGWMERVSKRPKLERGLKQV
jgi:hypothetical protein